ncbi:MAG: exodeoxyribonuclease VII small subunit [Candidatus Taylorbacteria bacterium]|jgi:exonuclease VII small subunit|nr:exodeoxyribonuclease VII small subunit [Candidatus Taylorbacteria bacterium]
MATEEKVNLKDSLKKLNDIAVWFEEQEEVDVEAGLERLKEGAELVKVCKKRLSEIENEFEQIQREVTEDSSSKTKAKKE